MNVSAMLRPAAAAVVLAGLCLTTVFGLAPGPRLRRDAPESPVGAPPDGPRQPRARSDSLAQLIAARDPFRLSRTAATTRFDPRGTETGSPPQVERRPAPVVAGILTGAEPSVLLEGIPGIEGARVLRAGERAGPYLVRSITPEGVVVVGPDTTWTLQLRTRFP